MYNPTVIDNDGRQERHFDIFSRLLRDRIIFLGTEVNDQVAASLVAQLLYLEAEDPTKDIILYINSPGGSVSAGLAIYDTMNYVKPDIQTVCIGQAASMGAFLLAAGTKGKRFALENSRIMIHQPLGGTGSGYHQTTDVQIIAKELQATKEKLAAIIAKNTGKSKEEVLEDTERDNYLTAEEAVSYGLIDMVMKAR
ncbi:MAG TPA: ATP-dependent Clp protease proteolytic subunit [Fusobacterium sp.]|uniref:ATP-dependent Clp protease proteolytic subunit n=1 Tax=Fusobacterium sp. TaxID=68766 RepID=UPI002F40F294